MAERIQGIADQMGYVTKTKRKDKEKEIIAKIGVVTQLAHASFMLEINRGIREAREELKERGIQVLVKEVASVDAKEQLCAIEELIQEKIQGLP